MTQGPGGAPPGGEDRPGVVCPTCNGPIQAASGQCERCAATVGISRDEATGTAATAVVAAAPVTPALTAGGTAAATTPVPAPAAIPASLTQRFEPLRELGSGGMGVVHLVRDVRLGREVALKLMRDLSPDMAGRFEREARLMASLEHENIVRVYEYGTADGVPYLLMEYVRGHSLASRLATARPTLMEAVRLTHDILGGVQTAHQKGIVHRDLKPANVFVDSAGRAKVADFGLALRIEGHAGVRESSDDSPKLTLTGMIMGTPGYIAPEAIAGKEPTGAMDIYAIGVMLHEMLTGQTAFSGKDVMAILAAQSKGQAAVPSQINPIVPASLDDLVKRAMALDPGERIAVGEFLSILSGWLSRPSRTTRALATGGLPPLPYKLLEHYEAADCPIFFGREAESTELVELLESPRCRVLFVFGPCGIGKSSLLRAGLLPRLDAHRMHTVVLVSGADPARALRESIAALAVQRGVKLPTGEDVRPSVLEKKPRLLLDVLLWLQEASGQTLVVVIDQLEELFTQNARDAKSITSFFDTVGRLGEVQALRLKLVLSYRTEFRGDFFPLEERLSRHQRSFQVREISAEGLVQAIDGPSRIETYAFRYSEGLCKKLVEDIQETTRRHGASALPLLQIVCAQLHAAMKARGLSTISTDMYDTVVGGARGALQRYVEERLASPAYLQRQGMARQMLKALTTKEEGGERFSKPRDEAELLAFPDRAGARQTLERLVADHLVLREAAAEGTHRRVRLASEVICPLVETWAVDPDDTERASRIVAWACRHWVEHGRRPDHLLSGGLLQFVDSRLGALQGISQEERAFVAEGVRRRERRFLVMVLLFGGLIGAVMALTLSRVSDRLTEQILASEIGRVTDARKLVEEFVSIRHQLLLGAARDMAASPRLNAALETGDPLTTAEEARWYQKRYNADLVFLTDAQGRVLASMASTGQPLTSVSQLPSRAAGQTAGGATESSRKPVMGTLVLGSVIYLVDTVPMGTGMGVSGHLTTGNAVKQDLADLIRTVASAQVVFLLGDRAVVSTLPQLGPGAATQARFEPPDAIHSRHPTLARLGDQQFVAVSWPLDSEGSTAASVLLLGDLGPAMAHLDAIRRVILGLGAVALLATLLISAVLTRRVSRWS